MAAKCTICNDARRVEIESKMAERGGSFTAIGEAFGLSPTAILRHRKHMQALVLAARQAGEIEEMSSIYRRIKRRMEGIESLVEAAAAAGDFRGAAALLKAAQSHDEMLLKLGEQP